MGGSFFLEYAAIARLTSVGLLRELMTFVGDAPDIGEVPRPTCIRAGTGKSGPLPCMTARTATMFGGCPILRANLLKTDEK